MYKMVGQVMLTDRQDKQLRREIVRYVGGKVSEVKLVKATITGYSDLSFFQNRLGYDWWKIAAEYSTPDELFEIEVGFPRDTRRALLFI